MSCGRPVVASRAGGLPDLVPDGVAGLLVPPGDEVALAGALARVLADAPLAERLGAGARVHAAGFGERVVVDRIEAAYERALAHVAERRRAA